MKKNIYVVSIILILLTGITIFFMQDIINYFNEEEVITMEDIKDDLFDVYLNTDKQKNKLSENDFLNGYWCEENNSVRFIKISQFIEEGYDKKDIENIIENTSNCKITNRDNITFVADEDLPEDEKFSNNLYTSSYLLDNKYLENKNALENKDPKTAMDYYKLSMIFSLEGEYKKSNQYFNQACKKDKKYCEKNSVKITGKVKDSQGRGISGVKVTLVSQGTDTITNLKGEYILNVKIKKLNKERLSFEKSNYSTTFLSVVSLSNLQKNIKEKNVEMAKSNKFYTIDLRKKTVDNDGKIEKNNVVLKTNKSIYEIPLNAFVANSGKKYRGIVKAYLYEFNGETVPQSLISLDSFSGDNSNDFFGTSMITFGMPYIIFKDSRGNRLDIKKSNPMVLTSFVQDLKEKMHGLEITDGKKEEILNNSKKGKFYYTLKQLDKDYLSLVPYWALDQKTGVWGNIGFDVIDKEGHLKTQFYTTK